MRWAAGLALFLFAGIAWAQPPASLPYDACFTKASVRFSVDKRILAAIAQTESSMRATAMGPRNANGTYDIGIMQINSWWLPTLNKLGIKEDDLKNACTNIHVGAWILAQNIGRHGATWKAVGAYNATSPDKQLAYVARVMRNYQIVGLMVNG